MFSSLESLESVAPLYTAHQLSLEQFEAFCRVNPNLLAEREPDGRIKIMCPVSFDSSGYEAEFIADLKLYARAQGGAALSSAVGLRLPDGSVRSPDACYVSAAKLSAFTARDRQHFLAVVPDFVVEVKSPNDDLQDLESKMRDTWIANGVRLAWLADVENDRLWIYRADHSVELVSPLDRTIDGEDVLPGFTFDLNLLS
ncbi:Uma2 family endonuclease [Neolewinella litorea]|uniref:Uma2 family endonuclease n=1 Tax=Neolewinella litorea TaxID=2562452 RepID=A0A4S4NLY3_9BACT|nr:Uma2 family endonuclease [Neolewinella litorea]THH39917.1 Uma2 family endonuclease [Neolewinella litorea]